MSEYYAVQRTGDELRHYGIKGMKWGVRKALNTKSSGRAARKLRKQYLKAENKLRKLSDKADLSRQKAAAKEHGKKALRSGLTSAALATLNYGFNNQYKKSVINNMKSGKHKSIPLNRTGTLELPTNKDSLAWLGAAGATAAGSNIGLTKSAYHTGKAIAAKHRSTKRGHAKAVAKRDAFKREMDKAFAGTQYASRSSKSGTPRQGKKRRSSGRIKG